MAKPSSGRVARYVMLDDCLFPPGAEQALAMGQAGIEVFGHPADHRIAFKALSGESLGKALHGARIRCKDRTARLDELCAPLLASWNEVPGIELNGSADGVAHYRQALGALGEGRMPQAGALFALLLGDQSLRGAAAYGLAYALSGVDAHANVIRLVEVLTDSEIGHPMLPALAGHAAAQLGDEAVTRRFMARAARGARGVPAYRDILRFAQRTLLVQQFGS